MTDGTPRALTVLLVEDDPVYARIVRTTLAYASGGPWSFEWVQRFEAARARLGAGGVDAVLLDLRLPDADGLEAVVRLGAEFPRLPVLALTAVQDEDLALLALQRGAQDHLAKGLIDETLLGRSIRYAIERKRTTDTLRQLEKAVETMSLGVSITDLQGRILYLNPAEAERHGSSVEELLGRQARDLSPPEDRRPFSAETAREFRPWKRERVRLRKDGTPFPVQLTSDLVTDVAGQPVSLVTTCEDITERKAAEQALRESEERYALAARGTNDGLWDWNLRTDRLYLSPRWKAMLGYEEDDVGEAPSEWLSRIHPDDLQKVQARLSGHLESRTAQFEVEHRIRHKDESYRWVLSRGFALRDATGRAYRMAGAQTDVTDRRAYDALTGLPNRVLFVERLHYAFARSKRRGDYLFAVVFIDLDHFKVVNDTMGHLLGDQLLIAVAKRLEGCLRPGDTVGRLAGDEFALLLETIRDASDTTPVAERIQKEMSAPFSIGGHEIHVSVSMGIAISGTSYEKPEDLLRDADAAMYRAKSLGRTRYEVFDAAMRQRFSERPASEDELRTAVDQGAFRLHYQPIVCLETGKLQGFEALVRWAHPQGRLALPGEFLPVAEVVGLLPAIGAWVLREACRQMREWDAEFPEAHRLSLAVNVSTRQFARGDLARDVETALRDHGLEPDRFHLELRESALLMKPQWVTPVLARLRKLGVRVDLDDFGTGYSSLNCLHRFPLNGVKLDGIVVAALAKDGESVPLASSVMQVARALGLEVVAEGVEEESQVEALRLLRCPRAQGRYFSPPLEPAAVAELLARQGVAAGVTAVRLGAA
jgi:diguanylate cyclase (GGDEF)-like protein/PAS domain S-box-containing protein